MKWTFPNPVHPGTTAAALLAEWEQRTQPLLSEAYSRARTGFLAQFQLLNRLVSPTAAVNVDEEDIRHLLQRAQSLRIGSSRAGGSARATHAIRLAAQHTQRHLLGPPPTNPATTALLYLASPPDMELELEELTTITEHTQAVFGRDLEIVFGHDTNSALDAQLEVCLLLGYGLPLAPVPAAPSQLSIPPEEVFPAAVCLVTEYQLVSSSLLQRHLGTGYNRTCRLLEELEEAGVIWQQEGKYGVVQIDFQHNDS